MADKTKVHLTGFFDCRDVLIPDEFLAALEVVELRDGKIVEDASRDRIRYAGDRGRTEGTGRHFISMIVDTRNTPNWPNPE